MRYFDEYFNKYGFNDGGSVPPDAEAYWVENMRIMNALLAKHGSDVRLVCWARAGLHNPLLLLRVPKGVFLWLNREHQRGLDCSGLECFRGVCYDEDKDEGWYRAIEEAEELELEGNTFVYTEAILDEDALDEFCSKIEGGPQA